MERRPMRLLTVTRSLRLTTGNRQRRQATGASRNLLASLHPLSAHVAWIPPIFQTVANTGMSKNEPVFTAAFACWIQREREKQQQVEQARRWVDSCAPVRRRRLADASPTPHRFRARGAATSSRTTF
jgi:hypothetical protein